MKSSAVNLQHVEKPKKETVRIDLLGDQFTLIKRGADDPEALKEAFAKARKIMATLPPANVDTVAAVRKHRRRLKA